MTYQTLKQQFPYPSQRMPAMARNMVATSHPLAVQAGLDAMRNGGNAVDAALATAITLTVVEPTMNGIGSDAFCIMWDGEQLHGLNASGRSPAAMNYNDFRNRDAMPATGWDTVTVPGAVSAWVELSERFGKLSFETLFESAVKYAEEGFMVTPISGRLWASAPEEFGAFPDFAPFLPGGKAPLAGALFKYPDQARTLEKIAASMGESFYRGELAEKIAATAKRDGGRMTMADLDNHRCDWVDLISQKYHGYDLHEIPPNGQGLGALIMLGILEHTDIQNYPLDSPDSVHCQIEAMKLAFADIQRYVADPAYMDLDPISLLDTDYLAGRAAMIDMKAARDPGFGAPKQSGTVYLTTADESGMMVSFIQSNFCGFGSGIVIPETGISLQNRGMDFSLVAGHPNQLDGNKRPFHTIIPAFLTKDGQPVMSFGVMGGHMQCQGHAQMVIRTCDFGMNPQAASDAPRWQVNQEKEILLESGFDSSVRAELESRGHNLAPADEEMPYSMGGAQLIQKTEHGYIGGSDHRKDGMAAGF
jgi:gamma-glutamyltranspeptidase/glutathione hydrolase